MYTTCILRTYYAYLIPYHLYHLSRCAWVEEGTEQDEKDERGPGSWGAGHLTAGDEAVLDANTYSNMYSICIHVRILSSKWKYTWIQREYTWIHDDTPKYTEYIQNTDKIRIPDTIHAKYIEIRIEGKGSPLGGKR